MRRTLKQKIANYGFHSFELYYAKGPGRSVYSVRKTKRIIQGKARMQAKREIARALVDHYNDTI